MTELVWNDQPRRLLEELYGLIAARAAAEENLNASFDAANNAAQKQYDQSQQAAATRHQRDLADTESEYLALRDRIVGDFQSERTAIEEQYDQRHAEILSQFADAERVEHNACMDKHWEATAVFEAMRGNLDVVLKNSHQRLETMSETLQAIRHEAEQVLRRRRQWQQCPPAAPESVRSSGSASRQWDDLVPQARDDLQKLIALRLSAMFENRQATLWAILISTVVVAATALIAGRDGWYWIPVGAVAMAGLSAVALSWLLRIARPQAWAVYRDIVELLTDANALGEAAAAAAEAEHRRQTETTTATWNAELKTADDAMGDARAALLNRKQESLKEATDQCAAERAVSSARHNALRSNLENDYSRRRETIEDNYRREVKSLEQSYQRSTADLAAHYQRAWTAMSGRWLWGVQRAGASVDAMNDFCRRLFPEWESPSWLQWRTPAEFPPIVPFGRLPAELGNFEKGLSDDARLRPDRTDFSLPLFFPLAERSLLLVNARGEGRQKAVEPLRSVMLRMLTGFPPGKVRLLILDPRGLGESFAAFMHLADFNDKLISNRIWTEPAHIEQRLAELTAHMENVIQVYLRNEFQSLHEYNASAGELAEPYRVLIVADFPANFSELAARRLLSIVQSGCRCGVYTLMSVDAAQRLPRGFSLADLEPFAMPLHCRDDGFLWEHPQMGELPVLVEDAPAGPRLTELVRRVGRESIDADRIELPFDWVVPAEADWWTGDSSHGIDVALGRSGVNTLQHLALGKGTSQHVLIAGKTGSGKSTLLHVLIVNAALRYAPDELEMFLVDFKKGVEFKMYAEERLPHARVVAIESEREFGLSVLECLDGELKRRGDLFRAHGVQDLQGFRALTPPVNMPRQLLIIDEFQELFVEDDRLAQSASLLLDRLVRQGRAFGIHVLLGSQTLSGAYSLARSTIGQMAVRIALQCSESDAHLILSEENTAARLLARPGEAIYNDANGLYEGNHPFQVVWFPDGQRRRYLQQLRHYPTPQNRSARPAIVFEGNVPADLAANPLLHELLAASAWPAECRAARVWLGEPVAIKEPTAAVFHRQSGANLLVVGHCEESALGIVGAALFALAAQHPPRQNGDSPGSRFFVFDGSEDDAPHADFFRRAASALPHDTKLVRPRHAAETLAEIAEELTRREQADVENAAPIYVIVYDLARFRDLRKSDDDYGLSRFDGDAAPSPSRQFRRILHDGPSVGIHCLVWADGYNTLLRSLDRQGLDDFEMRVVFRVNPSDSSSLIDSPAASQLGVHRAIFDDERQGRQEKFRPYAAAKSEWIAWAQDRLQR